MKFIGFVMRDEPVVEAHLVGKMSAAISIWLANRARALLVVSCLESVR